MLPTHKKIWFYKSAAKYKREIAVLMKCSKTAIDNIMFRKAVTNKMKRSGTTKKKLSERDSRQTFQLSTPPSPK